MEEVDDSLYFALQSKKSKFRVEIRQKHQNSILSQNRNKHLGFKVPQHNSKLSQQQNDEGQELDINSQLQQILIQIGQFNQQNKDELSLQFDILIDYILEKMVNEENKIREFQLVFNDDEKSAFLLDLLLFESNDKDFTFKQIILLGNSLCYSEEMCKLFIKGNYMSKLFNLMKDHSEDFQIIYQCFHCLYNIFSTEDFRDKILGQYPIIGFLEKQYITVFQLPELQQNEYYIVALISITEKIFEGPHLKCKDISKLISYIYEMMINAFKYSDPEYIFNSVISMIQEYLENNTDKNIQYFVVNHTKFLKFLISCISQTKGSSQILSNTSVSSQSQSQDSDGYNKELDVPQNIDRILNILINVTALDIKFDCNDLLYNFYKQTQLVKVLGWILYSPQAQDKVQSYVASLLSNIALSDLKTQNLIYSEKRLIKKINQILDEQIWGEVTYFLCLLSFRLFIILSSQNRFKQISQFIQKRQSCVYLVESGLFQQIAKILKQYYHSNSKTLKYALHAIETVLEVSENLAQNEPQKYNGYVNCFEELFNHVNDEIVSISGRIYDKFFKS